MSGLPMMVCFICRRVMEPSSGAATCWVKQTSKEHGLTTMRCPRCGTKVFCVNTGMERYHYEPEPGYEVLDLEDLE